MQVQATLLIEREGEELELRVEGDYTPSTLNEDDLEEDVYLEDMFLDGDPWDGPLTEEERTRSIKALRASGKSYRLEATDFDDDEDNDGEFLSILDFDDD